MPCAGMTSAWPRQEEGTAGPWCPHPGPAQPGAPSLTPYPPSWQLEPPDLDPDTQSHASVSWVVDPKPDSKRSLSTKYETTIF